MNRFSKRKWGWYLTLIDRKHFKVKLLWFKKGQSCSMQQHEYRAELWCFLSGEGKWGTKDRGRRRIMRAGDYEFVSPYEWHQFMAVKNTWVLEIQCGEKCVEQDIVRL